MVSNRSLAYLVLTLVLGCTNNMMPAIAESIVPAPDGTNTIVTPEGNRIDITGGMRSRNGENLFHSLLKFGLTPQEIANFLSQPEIRNILVRINGGEASLINGLIQVTGGNSNLFLMNPSGIVFGSNASLNVPGSFLATTANGIGFGNNWFNASGVNNYADLVGMPSAFAFTMNQPGSIVNAGNLAVGIGQDLGLIGGTVINTGNLSAPSGNISLMAVSGQSLVRVSQPGFVLSLDLQPQQTLPQNWTLPISSLPQLLTGGIGGNATGVTVNPDGSVQLTGSGIRIPTEVGTAIASGTINASAQEGIGGTVHILGDKVGLVSANVNASGTDGGGNVRIGGDFQGKGKLPNADRIYISSDSAISVDSLLFGDGGSAILWSDDTTEFYGSISAKGGKDGGDGGFVEVSGRDILVFNGNVDTSASQGNQGTLLLDPSTLTVQDTFGGGTQSTNLASDEKILSGDPNIPPNTITWLAIDSLGKAANVVLEATGNITIANVTGASTGTTSNNLVQLDLDTGSLRITSTNGSIIFTDPQDQIRTEGGAITLQAQGGTIAAGQFNTTGAGGDKFGNVTLEAKGNLSAGNITTGGGNISLTSGGTINATGTINSKSTSGDGGAIALTATGNITTNQIIFAPSSVVDSTLKINTPGIVNINGDITSNGADIFIGGTTPVSQVNLNLTEDTLSTRTGNIAIVSSGALTLTKNIVTDGGAINLTGTSITTSGVNLDSSFRDGDGGAIALNATGNITTGNIDTRSLVNGGTSGTVNIISSGGAIDTSLGTITTKTIDNATVNGGAVTIAAKNDITTGGIQTFVGLNSTGKAGDIFLTSQAGSINTQDRLDAGTTNGSGGQITLNAQGNITSKDLLAYVTNGGSGTGGNISVTSTQGSFNITQGRLDSSSNNGNGGAIAVSAAGNITTGSDFDSFLVAVNSASAGNGNGGNINFTSSGGSIDTTAGSVDSSSTNGNGGAIAFSAPTSITAGNINADGIPNGGDISLTSNQFNFTGGNDSVSSNNGTLLLQPFTASQSLSLNPTTIAPFVDGFNSITIGRSDGTGNITIATPITFNDPTTIQSPGGAIAINAPITGTDNASITIIGGTNNLAANITTAEQDISISGTNTIGNNITISTGTRSGGNITFSNTIDGNNNLTLETGTGDIFIAGAIGGNTRLGDLTINSANNVVAQAITAASITQKAGTGTTSMGALNTNSAAGINLTGNSFNLNGNITTTNNGSFRIDNASPLTLVGSNFNLDGSFNQVGKGAVSFSGNLSTTNDNISFNAPVTLTGNTEFNAGTALISINSGLTGGSNNLTLTADGIELGGSISGNGNLVLQPFTPSQAIALGIPTNSGANSLDLSQGELNNLQNGFKSITIGRADSSGTISIANSISFQDPVTIRSPIGAGSISFNGGSISGTNDATIALIANQSISTGDITAPAGITITSNSGGIDSSAGRLDASNLEGSGGAIALSASSNITTGGITTKGTSGGGNINLAAANGAIDTKAGNIESWAENGNGGTVSFTAAGNITTGNIDSSSDQNGDGGAINLTSNSGAINTQAGTLDSSSLDGKGGAIALSAPNSITVAGIDASGNPGGDIRLTSNGINFTGIANSVRSNGTLTLQPFTPNDNLTLTANNLATLRDGFSAIAIGWNNGTGTITLANPITFSDPVTIQSPNGSILVNGAIAGLDNASITLTGNTTLNADITTTNQNLTINGNTILGNSVTLATGGGNLLLNGTVNGNNNLTLAAGTGNITLNSLVGNTTRLGNLTINSANNVQTQSITATSIAQTGATGNTTLGSLNTNSAAGIDLTGNTFNFNGNITTTNNGGLRINNSGAANFPATTNINLDGAFNQVGTGNVSIAGNITTTNDDIRFNGPVTLTGNTNFNPGIAAIAFNSTLNTGNNPLTLTASEIDFGGAVSGTNTLTLQPATSGQNITIGASTPGNLNLTIAEIANLQDGFSAIAIGRADGTGTISVNSVTFNDPVTIQNGVGAIAINQPISGAGNASITLDAATINLNANITTASQNLTIGRNTILGTDVTLSTLNSGNIIFNGPVNGNYQLTLNAGTGSIRFNGGAGLTTPISNLNIASAQNIFVAGGISTNNNLTLNTPVTLTEDATFRTGSIVFNNTLDSEANEANNLTLNINGDISFNGAVGSIGRLGAIAIENANNLSATSTIQANSIRHLNGTGTIDLAGNITTTGEGVNLVTRNNIRTGNITSNGGQIRLTSREGTVTTGTLNSSSAGSGGSEGSEGSGGRGGAIALTSPLGAVTTSDLNTSGVSSGGNITVVSGDRINTGNINTSAAIGNGGTVILDPPNDIQVGFINAQGGTSGRGGNVDVTTERFFRATNAFTDRNNLNSSISTAGGSGGGTIAISHGGGDLQTPFIVGDATINGTASALTTGINTISPIRIFPGRFTLGNIAIITSDRLTSNLEESIIRRENPPTQRAIANIPPAPIDILVGAVEEVFTRDYETYLGKPNTTIIKTLGEIQLQLRQAQQATGVKTAVIYIVFGRGRLGIEALLACSLESRNPEINATISQQQTCSITDNDPVEMVLVTAEGEPIRTRISGATRGQILTAARQFRINILDEENRSTNDYLEPAKQLYQWLISPLEADLKARGIQNIVFIPDAGLRTTPFAALHNGQNFVISQYSISLMPSFSLTRPRYANLKDASVLAMGASKFTDLSPLPAVPVELSTITPQLWPGTTELNEGFTVENLKLERTEKSYRIIHLATHAQFLSGPPSNSYIQFWDKKLYLDQLDQFNWSNPPVELLVLSACRTAVGDREVELGFAGLAVQAGVQSALASLWYVSDEGTLGLMTEFYEQLKTAPTRSEALRRAQMAMVTEEVRLENGQLLGPTRGGIPLPSALTRLGDLKFTHPYYWASFTMIGNPW